MSAYEIAILGSPTDAERSELIRTIEDMVADFGLRSGIDIIFHDTLTVANRDKRAAFAAAYFGADANRDIDVVEELIKENAPVIPTVKEGGVFNKELPPKLQVFNGLKRRAADTQMAELAAAVLECIGLLRRQRRVFISYRRDESRIAAIQLHDLLAARAFDVFLDTHSIRPGDPFQDVLWHRLCDSDVLLMLETRTFIASKWTRQELGRALSKGIHVFRLVWPDYTPSALTGFSETKYLENADFLVADGPIVGRATDDIILTIERLRSRSIASRYMAITGRLKSEVEKIGAAYGGVGMHRGISIQLTDGCRILAYPIVGIPTAELLNDVERNATGSGSRGTPILVYDHVGISNQWALHLRWLDERINSVRALKVGEAGWTLAAWDNQ